MELPTGRQSVRACLFCHSNATELLSPMEKRRWPRLLSEEECEKLGFQLLPIGHATMTIRPEDALLSLVQKYATALNVPTDRINLLLPCSGRRIDMTVMASDAEEPLYSEVVRNEDYETVSCSQSSKPFLAFACIVPSKGSHDVPPDSSIPVARPDMSSSHSTHRDQILFGGNVNIGTNATVTIAQKVTTFHTSELPALAPPSRSQDMNYVSDAVPKRYAVGPKNSAAVMMSQSFENMVNKLDANGVEFPFLTYVKPAGYDELRLQDEFPIYHLVLFLFTERLLKDAFSKGGTNAVSEAARSAQKEGASGWSYVSGKTTRNVSGFQTCRISYQAEYSRSCIIDSGRISASVRSLRSIPSSRAEMKRLHRFPQRKSLVFVGGCYAWMSQDSGIVGRSFATMRIGKLGGNEACDGHVKAKKDMHENLEFRDRMMEMSSCFVCS